MIDPAEFPSAMDPVEIQADYLELMALKDQSRAVSFREVVRDFELACASETLMDSDFSDEPSGTFVDSDEEWIVDAVFKELDRRSAACGENIYPFDVHERRVVAHSNADKSVYTFLALLSWYGGLFVKSKPTAVKIFEEVCASAAEAYLGGPHNRVRSYVFGAPRRVGPAGFADALDFLCGELGEGIGSRLSQPKLSDEKDCKLDVVAWRDFEDRRQGKLITFGQCATGKNWPDKITELGSTAQWCSLWLQHSPAVPAIPSFFVPHRVEEKDWEFTCYRGGILFDRCRITSLSLGLNAQLRTECIAWAAQVLKRVRVA